MLENTIVRTLPCISVVMAIYNEPIEWIRISIDSILNQTFNDFEFIIINDNPSRDENRKVLQEYSNRDSRVVIISNVENIGLTRSLNKGLEIAKGEFIARMDADDVSYPSRFEKQVEFLKKNPQVGVVGCNAYVINEKSEIISKINRPTEMDVLRYLSIFESPIYHPASFYRKIISNERVRYDETIKYSQDYALWISLLKICDISNIQDRLIQYRVTDLQISRAHHSLQQQYAFKNQMVALSDLGIILTEDDIEYFKFLTRTPASNKVYDYKLIRNFIVRFLKNNQLKLSVGFEAVRDRLILIYANVIANEYTLPNALFSLLRLQIETRRFYIYSFMSLVNKYVIKFKIKYIC